MFAVAIDGPAGAGKSSVAKAAAKELGFVYVDTGAIYRTIALHVLRQGVDPHDAPAVEALLPQIQVGLAYTPEGQKMLLNGEDVTGLIRTPEVSMATSACSAIPAVRAYLLQLQRDLAEKKQRAYGRPGHRHRGAAPGPAEGVPHRLAPRSGPGGGWPSWRRRASRRTTRPFCGTSSSGTTRTPTGRRPPCARRRTRCCWTTRTLPSSSLWSGWWAWCGSGCKDLGNAWENGLQ